jgi:hypothetical protein
VTARISYYVYVSGGGNIFMTEIASLLAAALRDRGYRVIFPAPGLPEPESGRVNLVVAPHEFFTLQPGLRDRDLLEAAECAVSVGVEQPGTEWFELGTHYASAGPALLDINPYAVKELRRRGLDATHLQLGYHPSIDRWGGRPEAPRPTDLLFMGVLGPRRARLLARAGPLLWGCTCDLRLFEVSRPMTEPRGMFVSGEEKWNLLASSRVLVNFHQDETPYFEWVRVLEAMANGCLVISEVSSDYGPLVPGEHLVAAPAEDIGAYAASLLNDEPLRAEMAGRAYEMVRDRMSLVSLLEPVCDHLDHLGRTRRRPRASHPFVPAARPAETVNPLLAGALSTELRARSRIKELYDSETLLLREVEALQAEAEFGDRDHASLLTTPAWEGLEPEVSVVVTCYNYAHFVIEAIESAMASQGVDLELVVIDDHSSDDSVPAIEELMAANPWFPMMLVARQANGGVARARNAAMARARADLLFMLDGDNVIFPPTLRRLAEALKAAPDADFAYGVLPRSDGSGVLSHLPWDVARLCRGNYIDTMAMIRQTALVEIGGYDEYFGLRGLEDYELWLRFAAAGRRGEFVPCFMGSYRVHPTSRQTTVDLDAGAVNRDLRARFPYLPWS